MADLALAKVFVDLELRGKLKDYLASQRAGISDFQQKLRDGTYMSYAQTAKKINAVNKTIAKDAHWQDLVVQHGKFFAGLAATNEQLGVMKDKFSGIGIAAGVTFAAGTAAILAFTGAASPDAVNTFTGSLMLLSAEIGMDLIPYLREAAYWLQDVRAWYRELTPATKEWIAALIIGGTVAAGLTVIIFGMTAAVVSLTGALLALGLTPIGAMLTAIGAPLVIAGLALAGGAAAAIVAKGMLSSAREAGAGGRMGKDGKDYKQATTLATPGYFGGVAEAHKAFQLDILKDNDIQTEILATQRRGNEINFGNQKLLEDIAGKKGGMRP